MKLSKILVILILLSLFQPAWGWAPVPQRVLNSNEAGLINKEAGNRIYNPAEKSDYIDEKENIKGDQPEETAVKEIKSPVFKLNNVIFSGNKVYKEQRLLEFTNEVIGQDVTINDINKVCTKIKHFYRKNGYITTLVYVPPQKIEDGTVKIEVLEGKTGQILVKNEGHTKHSYIKNAILNPNGVKAGKPLNINRLNYALSDINQKDYLNGKIQIQKGEAAGTSDIILELEEKSPFGFSVNWDNSGQELTGKNLTTLLLSNENVTGFGDNFYTGVVLGNGTLASLNNYSVPIGPYGTTLNVGYTFSHSDIKKEYKALDISGRAHNIRTSIIQPIKRGKNWNLQADISFDALQSVTYSKYQFLNNKYDLRVLRTGLNYTKDDRTGRFFSRLEVSNGLPILGGIDRKNKSEGDSNFVKVKTTLLRYQRLPLGVTGIFKTNVQYTPQALLSAEQLSVGGANTVRGHDPSTMLADVGYTFSAELVRPVPFLPRAVKRRLQLAVFYDHGYAREINRGLAADAHYNDFIQGLGAGLRFNLTRACSFKFDIGIPIGNKELDNHKNVKFHFGLMSNLF